MHTCLIFRWKKVDTKSLKDATTDVSYYFGNMSRSTLHRSNLRGGKPHYGTLRAGARAPHLCCDGGRQRVHHVLRAYVRREDIHHEWTSKRKSKSQRVKFCLESRGDQFDFGDDLHLHSGMHEPRIPHEGQLLRALQRVLHGPALP